MLQKLDDIYIFSRPLSKLERYALTDAEIEEALNVIAFANGDDNETSN